VKEGSKDPPNEKVLELWRSREKNKQSLEKDNELDQEIKEDKNLYLKKMSKVLSKNGDRRATQEITP